MPDGWHKTALASRITMAGLCSYQDLASGRVSARDFFEMQRIVDWDIYCQNKLVKEHGNRK